MCRAALEGRIVQSECIGHRDYYSECSAPSRMIRTVVSRAEGWPTAFRKPATAACVALANRWLTSAISARKASPRLTRALQSGATTGVPHSRALSEPCAPSAGRPDTTVPIRLHAAWSTPTSVARKPPRQDAVALCRVASGLADVRSQRRARPAGPGIRRCSFAAHRFCRNRCIATP